ncbi:MAG: hypothetical protein JSU70_01320 [Phycisphaerales bacterium]|nr:MAG: hypothetical protein JSU70_01320 [Phycisphaerales bacterium]
MDMYDSMFPPSYVLNEQVARHVFGSLPEQGPIVAIIDKAGNRWPSSSEEFSALNIDESLLNDICAKVDDGAEPVITQANGASIAAAQLATDQTDCGYLIVALPRYCPESTLTHTDLIETVLNQITLIAKLIENNRFLCELQTRHHAPYRESQVPSN